MGTDRTRPRRLLTPYPWYVPFRTRLRKAWLMAGHRSLAYTGNINGAFGWTGKLHVRVSMHPDGRRQPWPRWRQQIARMFVILDVFLSQPEYYFVSHYDLSYPQCGRIR